jgi:hypothetical protein
MMARSRRTPPGYTGNASTAVRRLFMVFSTYFAFLSVTRLFMVFSTYFAFLSVSDFPPASIISEELVPALFQDRAHTEYDINSNVINSNVINSNKLAINRFDFLTGFPIDFLTGFQLSELILTPHLSAHHDFHVLQLLLVDGYSLGSLMPSCPTWLCCCSKKEKDGSQAAQAQQQAQQVYQQSSDVIDPEGSEQEGRGSEVEQEGRARRGNGRNIGRNIGEGGVHDLRNNNGEHDGERDSEHVDYNGESDGERDGENVNAGNHVHGNNVHGNNSNNNNRKPKANRKYRIENDDPREDFEFSLSPSELELNLKLERLVGSEVGIEEFRKNLIGISQEFHRKCMYF